MAYFEVLSEYKYFARHCRSGAKNLGWLELDHSFETAGPAKETLDLLWSFWVINVMQARGFHSYELCVDRRPYIHAQRNGLRLSLG